jgi:bifunctional non-homologous end joining protein LigD
MSLKAYHRKRRFNRTAEPRGGSVQGNGASFVVQKHDASRLHYDFRLELDGVLKSWAVPKGPSLDPSVKALAVHVEDHPREYADFEGTIPAGEYGGGTVMVWDKGTWQPEGDARAAYTRGSLTFRLFGSKLKGRWKLFKMGGRSSEDGKNWLLMKLKDSEARTRSDPAIVDEQTRSVLTGRSLEEIANGAVKPTRAGKKPAAPRESGKSTRRRKQQSDAPPDTPAGARKRAMPRSIRLELATLVREAPSGDNWIFELKFDGYRLLAYKNGARVKILTRAEQDWTRRFPSIAKAVAQLTSQTAIVDGEAVILSPDGTSDFQAMQNILRRGNDRDVVYFAFDLLYCDGFDLRSAPLLERKSRLQSLIAASPNPGRVIRYSDHLQGPGPLVFSHACRSTVEGLIAKRIDSRYEEGRSSSWLKLKCAKRQEFVIGGWSDPTGSRRGFGALLLGYYAKPGELIYCGRVGTGFRAQTLADLRARLDALSISRPPFVIPRRSALPMSTGLGPNSWPRSPLRAGRPTASCATRFSTDSGKTRNRPA